MNNSKPVIHPEDADDRWDYGDDVVDLNSIDGKHISEIIITYGWERYKSGCVVPDSHHLNNFDLVGEWSESLNRKDNPPARTSRTFLVLDDYGNEWLPDSIEDRLLGSAPYTIAIDKETGVIYVMAIRRIKLFADTDRLSQEEQYAAFLWPFPQDSESFKVPEHYLPRLNELKNHKRPFRITIDSYWLLQFCEREASFGDLEERLVVSLEFDSNLPAGASGRFCERGTYLEVGKKLWREVTPWRDISDEEDDDGDDE